MSIPNLVLKGRKGANSLAANARGKFDRSALFFLVISKGGVFECCETTN